MIALAHNLRALPIIGAEPELQELEIPPLFIQPPKVIKFTQDTSKVNHITITLKSVLKYF